jgi:hypothetical protein
MNSTRAVAMKSAWAATMKVTGASNMKSKRCN